MKNKWILAVAATIIILVGGWLIFSNNNIGRKSAAPKVGTSVGDIAPEFTVTTLDGKTINSEALRGKTVVVTSSAAWCNTCVIEAQEFAQVYPKFSGEEVVFITVDIDPRNSVEAIKEFQANTNSPWHYANASGGADIANNLKLKRFEITYVMDRDGVIQYKDSKITSAEELTDAVQKTL